MLRRPSKEPSESVRSCRNENQINHRAADATRQHAQVGCAAACRPTEAASGRDQMTISAVSHYRGGTIDVVTPIAKALKAAYLKHGVAYRLSRFETGPNVGDWLVITTCDKAAYEEASA